MTEPPFDTFLNQLQQEAEHQAKLSKTRLLPQHLDWLTSLIGSYSWQTLLLLSGITAIGMMVTRL